MSMRFWGELLRAVEHRAYRLQIRTNAPPMAVVTLGNPREKFWGARLVLIPEGLSLCGIE